MNKYELFYILNPNMEEEALEEHKEWVKSLIEKNNGEILELDKWSKRRLAYEIDDHREGTYMLGNFKGDPVVVDELERAMKLNENIIRNLIIRLN